MRLRPYQEQAVSDLRQQYQAGRIAPMCTMPTGAGKTPVLAEIAKLTLQRNLSVGVLVPRIELLNQAVAKLADAGITDPRVIQASNDNGSRDSRIFVGSIPTLTGERWQGQLPPADLLIIDEAHHSKANTHERLLLAYPNARRLGFSATPQRGDGKGLGELFDAIVVGATVRQLTVEGYLVPCKIYAPPRIMDSRELAQDPVDAYLSKVLGRKAIVFCSTVEQAKQTAESFSQRGVSAQWVSGDSKDRDDIIAAFKQRAFDVLVNVSILIEGFDDPAIEAAIFAKRFTHVGSYLQAIGRILRPFPGKLEATVIDLCGSALVHGTPDLDREYSLTGKGISKTREPIRQCQQCGGVFKYAPSCPFCAFASPPLTRAEKKALGLELEEVANQNRTSWPMRAKRAGLCSHCHGLISQGAWIVYSKVQNKAMHTSCAAKAARSAA